MEDSSRRPVFCLDQTARMLSIALAVAKGLTTSAQVEAAVAVAERQRGASTSMLMPWSRYSVARGSAGLALLFGYLDQCFPEAGWDRVAHHHLTQVIQGIEDEPYLPIGLFGGLSGVAFVCWYLSRHGARYPKLQAALDAQLIPQAVALGNHLNMQRTGLAVDQFDLISGLTGIGTYLLCRIQDAAPYQTLEGVLASLIALTRANEDPPRWHTPPNLLAGKSMIAAFPHGNLNCGLAHGIPGPLALFSLARLAGVAADGLVERIEYIAEWLLQHRLDDPWGINWPIAVPLATPAAASFSVSAPLQRPSHTGWCYGSPGIARALWLAGKALNRPAYCDFAVAAMEAVYHKPINERRIDSPTFCHGVAGLLQITLRFAYDTGLEVFAEATRTLVSQLLSLYRPESHLGFANIEPHDLQVDHPGLLDGSPGVTLVLLAAATGTEPAWDRFFLLS